jgi:large subunit ribosomal protein L24
MTKCTKKKEAINRKLHKGDEVIVLSGRDKGRRGEITELDPMKGLVIVQNMNQVKKHVRPNPRVNEEGGIKPKEMPMPISKVAIFNEATGKADRVGYKVEKGKKIRVFKSSGEPIKSKKA